MSEATLHTNMWFISRRSLHRLPRQALLRFSLISFSPLILIMRLFFQLIENVYLIILLYSCGIGLEKAWFRTSARNWKCYLKMTHVINQLCYSLRRTVRNHDSLCASKVLERQLHLYVTKQNKHNKLHEAVLLFRVTQRIYCKCRHYNIDSSIPSTTIQLFSDKCYKFER
jgi:hypothetical protein